MSNTRRNVLLRRAGKTILAGTVLACLASFASIARAEDRPYTEAAVMNVASIRTEYGKFDDYMKFLAGTWKQGMEAAKKSGLIVDYQVITAHPKGPDDADIYLVIKYKNWAALDGLSEKMDAIEATVYGSVTASQTASVGRGKMRRVLGSQDMQVLNLK